MLIETDAMDLHKTKQLAFVMNILTERNLHEKVWEGVKDEKTVHDMMASMVKATSNLIMANRKTPVYANDTSLSGIKNTIPLDLNGFTWLAKTVDYIIEQCEAVECKLEKEIANLKTDFFRFGVYRLAGGLDNSPGDN